MSDITDPATRSRMMSGIKGKNTKPELIVRRALHARGFRFRLHAKELAGKPDVILPMWDAAVFVHGCFWHQHAGCTNARIPATRRDFWIAKLSANVERDARHSLQLQSLGWRVAIVWECSIRTAVKSGDTTLFERLATWLRDVNTPTLEI
jgi:DNA mismatch endonuclease (patch repair protein)